MKIRSSLAGALLLAAPVIALVSGCGGGGSGTAIPTNTPIPGALIVGTATANLSVTSNSNSNVTFGESDFKVNDGRYLLGQSGRFIGFGNDGIRYVTLSGINPANLSPGIVQSLDGSSTIYLSATYGKLYAWGGLQKTTGIYKVLSIEGKTTTLELQNVVLSQIDNSGIPASPSNTLTLNGTITFTDN